MNKSNRIYFNSSKNIQRVITLCFTTAYRYVNKQSAMKFARNTLLLPHKYEKQAPKNFKQTCHTVLENEIMVYELGKGPEVLFLHGWSGGSFQFYSLMKKVSSLGFKAVALDFPGHGLSSKTQTSLPNMINTFNALTVIKKFNPQLVICHSVGSSVFANSEIFKQYKNNTLLISPLIKTYPMLVRSSKDSGFNQSLFNGVVEEVGDKEGLSVPKLDADEQFKVLKGDQLTIIHDTNDPFAPIEDSVNLANDINCELITTSNISHARLIASNTTLTHVKKLLA